MTDEDMREFVWTVTIQMPYTQYVADFGNLTANELIHTVVRNHPNVISITIETSLPPA